MKGFAAMDDERKKNFARKGGLASAMAKKTSNRGFASMDKTKLREISRMGGIASQSLKGQRAVQNEGDAEKKDIHEQGTAEEREMTSPERERPSDPESTEEPLSHSETDEDEDEGLGDGNLGRSSKGM